MRASWLLPSTAVLVAAKRRRTNAVVVGVVLASSTAVGAVVGITTCSATIAVLRTAAGAFGVQSVVDSTGDFVDRRTCPAVRSILVPAAPDAVTLAVRRGTTW